MSLSSRIKHLANILAGSESKLAPAIGVHPRALNRLINDESPKLWTFLPAILSRYPEISRDWLYFGEGEMTGTAPAPAVKEAAAPEPAQSMPVTGFAACGTQGWGGKMTFPLAVSAPHSRPGMLAVMATGESMIPEGIGHGHICFCDPGITPMPGECVYVETADHKAALKAFVGRGEAAGHGTREGEICLRGWMDKQGNAPQKDFYLRIPAELVLVLAPVVYVQRRL